jgi:hypothetical protein
MEHMTASCGRKVMKRTLFVAMKVMPGTSSLSNVLVILIFKCNGYLLAEY